MRNCLTFKSLFVVLALLILCTASKAQIAVGISVGFAPPELPVYEQPICPADGYIWTPGYWAWDGDDYFWVPGTWVEAPQVGYFWTPPYWGWGGNAFFFHEGYWGPVVGFYGGINYGYGYFGRGYEGGRWDGGHFFYNREVNNVNVTVIHNVYNKTVINENVTRVSYNGGNGGINVRATAEEQAAERERHLPPVAAQSQHFQAARGNAELRASANHGKPPIAATSRPGSFTSANVVTAKEGGRYTPPPAGGANASRPPNPSHVKELPPISRSPLPSSGNPNTDKKYQQQQDKLAAKQDQERAKLQQKQEQDHQRLEQQKASEVQRQQMEQRHQQQTQQLQQRHVQQQQHFEQHVQPQHQAAPKH